jgi:hypothetical protein
MRAPPKPISSRRLARLSVYAQAVFAWAALAFFGGVIADRRRVRRRYTLLSLATLTHVVRNLMIARAGELIGKHRPCRPKRNDAPQGFRRRMRARNILRSIAGSRLRRFMCAGDFATRFARLAHMISNLDVYVRAYLLPRARHGVNRVRPIVLTYAAAVTVRSLAVQAVTASDTS